MPLTETAPSPLIYIFAPPYPIKSHWFAAKAQLHVEPLYVACKFPGAKHTFVPPALIWNIPDVVFLLLGKEASEDESSLPQATKTHVESKKRKEHKNRFFIIKPLLRNYYYCCCKIVKKTKKREQSTSLTFWRYWG